MQKKLLITTAVSLFALSGCMSNNGGGGYAQQQGGYSQNSHAPIGQTTGNSSSTTSHTTGSLKSAIAYMVDEERLAQDVYLAIYKRQPVQQLSQIATRAEANHIRAVSNLASTYGVALNSYPSGRYASSKIQSLYNELYAKGIRSKKDAFEVGCMVEVVDIDDLNEYVSLAQRENASDALNVFDRLRSGSYKHYWAFDRGLKQMGVSNGCCSLGTNYCHPEYPQNSQGGHGRGQGQGRGQGGGRGMGWGR